MKMVRPWLGLELLFVHFGHGLLFLLGIAIVAWQAPWWPSLIAVPLVLFSFLFWLYEATFVLPTAMRLLRREAGGADNKQDQVRS